MAIAYSGGSGVTGTSSIGVTTTKDDSLICYSMGDYGSTTAPVRDGVSATVLNGMTQIWSNTSGMGVWWWARPSIGTYNITRAGSTVTAIAYAKFTGVNKSLTPVVTYAESCSDFSLSPTPVDGGASFIAHAVVSGYTTLSGDHTSIYAHNGFVYTTAWDEGGRIMYALGDGTSQSATLGKNGNAHRYVNVILVPAGESPAKVIIL